MFAWLIGSPAAMPFEVPIGWPYCSTNSPAGMARVAKRWPGGTGPDRTSSRPPPSPTTSPLASALLTTATLSRGETTTAQSDSGRGAARGSIGLILLRPGEVACVEPAARVELPEAPDRLADARVEGRARQSRQDLRDGAPVEARGNRDPGATPAQRAPGGRDLALDRRDDLGHVGRVA